MHILSIYSRALIIYIRGIYMINFIENTISI